MPSLRPSRKEDAIQLSSNLRKADLEEIQASIGGPPVLALLIGLNSSDVPMTIVDDDGTILAMFGVVEDDPTIKSGLIWLLASDGLLKHRRQFIRQCRQWVDALQDKYNLLWNVVDSRNAAHIRWLKWCGFIFLREIPEYGVEARPFLEFVRINNNNV